jgi:hypothetical protein
MIERVRVLLQLFDFDIEVKPTLEVLIGKTMEQALLEVMEEEELANLRLQQREHGELRYAENIEQQRLEEQDRRMHDEKVCSFHRIDDILLSQIAKLFTIGIYFSNEHI